MLYIRILLSWMGEQFWVQLPNNTFFQRKLPTGNTASSFSALIQQSQRQMQQLVMPRPDSWSSPHSFVFSGRRIRFLKNLQFSFPLKHLFTWGPTSHFTASYLMFPFPILISTVETEKSPRACNQIGCILHLDANLGALQNLMLTQTHMKNSPSVLPHLLPTIL